MPDKWQIDNIMARNELYILHRYSSQNMHGLLNCKKNFPYKHN